MVHQLKWKLGGSVTTLCRFKFATCFLGPPIFKVIGSFGQQQQTALVMSNVEMLSKPTLKVHHKGKSNAAYIKTRTWHWKKTDNMIPKCMYGRLTITINPIKNVATFNL